MAKYFSFTI